MTKARRRPPLVLPQRVVGIGASAGGLDALRQLVEKIPLDTRLAVVVLQHLPPSQTGQLASLLAKSTTLPVINAESGRRIEPNTILVVPPHTCATMFRGALVLRKAKAGKRPYLPIDQLFESLAKVLGERAVGVVLSGTAHDGTEGLRAIQTAGGLTFAQDPSSAQFDQMPRSAIVAGVAEAVMTPAHIGEELGVLAKLGPRPVASAKSAASGIEQVLDQLREASGIDFTSYKRSTIERRLARRLAKFQLDSLDEYSSYLTEHPAEALEVYEDLLIHVTEFFRDPEVLDRLVVSHIVPELVTDKPADEPIRVWVPGCSTGEEVYSIAMLLAEHAGNRRIQLFGSDLSEKAIEIARIGRYPVSIAEHVGATRLERFFHREDGTYRINRDIRERCVFVRHDLVTDPPFSKVDLVSCRNVLIYLGPELQKRVIPIFHYALNQPGYLLLGPAEAITGFETLFASVDAESRIFTRKPAARTSLTFPIAGKLGRQAWRRPADLLRSTLDVQRDVDHVLLARYAPACVLVDENLDVLQFRGRTGPYLESPSGQPQLNLLRMAREGLAAELPIAIQGAQRTDTAVRRENVVIRERNHDRQIHLEVIPVRGTVDGKRHFLVVFEEATGTPEPAARKGRQRREPGDLVRAHQELAATKEYLHSVVTQHLATTEELAITNEELQSANEELQSSNEELQTAKEELQSTNEELETVNEELQRGNQLLHEANDDLVNVLASVEIGIIIVDTERRVRRFTPKARAVMKLIPGDIGRPIADLQPTVAVDELDTMIEKVIDTLEVHEAEVRHADGTWYRLQVRPYRTSEHKISGAVIAFVDITALRIAREYPAAIVEAVPTPLVVIDDRLRVRSANAAFYTAFGTTEPDVTARKLLDVGDWRSPVLRGRLEELVATGTGFDDIELLHSGHAGDRALRLGARSVPTTDGHALFLIAIVDVTERQRLEQVRAAAQRERESFLDAVSHELRTPISVILLWAEALRDLTHDDPRRTQAIDTILDSARAEAHLIDDLIELALLRSTELTVKLESIEPAAIVQAAVDAARPVAQAKQIAIETKLVPVPRITADPRRLQQIASNLISNAIKFTPPGGQVSVSMGLSNDTLELRVRDSGPGIAPEFLARVFDPFSQADRSSTREQGGLGIGLALVRHFVERQGGTIDVASRGDGHGTTFTVHLPAAHTHS